MQIHTLLGNEPGKPLRTATFPQGLALSFRAHSVWQGLTSLGADCSEVSLTACGLSFACSLSPWQTNPAHNGFCALSPLSTCPVGSLI
jgi:hypothetical protein